MRSVLLRQHSLRLPEEFCIINKERQDTETEILQEVIREIEEKRMHETDTVLVLAGDNWHHGVIGIVCSRITEKYNLPSILISFDTCKDAEKNDENVGKGSARSIKPTYQVVPLLRAIAMYSPTFPSRPRVSSQTVGTDAMNPAHSASRI